MKFNSAQSARKLVLVLVAIFAIVAGSRFFHMPEAAPGAPLAPDGTLDPASAQRYWTWRIERVGGEKAYQEFLAAYGNQDFKIQHNAAHLMGHILYQTLGIQGLPICDNSFSFGCYHQFFVDALSAGGIGIVPQLDKACVDKYGPKGSGCQHGIGHGLEEYFGSSDQALLKELSACDMTTSFNANFGCTSGVFMQYNEPIDLQGSRVLTDLRPLNEGRPYDPCGTIVPEQYKSSCYFSLPQWWMTQRVPVKQVGAWCEASPEEYRQSCYQGTGTVVAPTEDYNIAQTIATCNLMPTAQGKLLCRASASWSFFAMPTLRSEAASVCEGLSVQDQHYCVRNSDLIGDGEIFKAEQQK